MVRYDRLDSPQFVRTESEVACQGHRIKPELGRVAVAIHVNVGGVRLARGYRSRVGRVHSS